MKKLAVSVSVVAYVIRATNDKEFHNLDYPAENENSLRTLLVFRGGNEKFCSPYNRNFFVCLMELTVKFDPLMVTIQNIKESLMWETFILL